MRLVTKAVCLSATASLLFVVLAPRTASACGGCFAPVSEETAVDAHRMVLAVGVEETVLWDQIVYSGNPKEFVWVLPVPTPNVTVDVADPAFFDSLDSASAPQVTAASFAPTCGSSGSAGFGCGMADLAADGAGGQPTDGVTVYDQSTVGPYETAIIGSEDSSALYTWLTDNGYNIPAETTPTIDHYVAQDYVFVALRLSPGEGVQAMEPVRIHFPGAITQFPLKMVVVGAQGVLDLALWIIADQRYEASNYAMVEIDENDLAWDWDAGRSTYNEVFLDTIDDAGGRAWVTEYAGPLNSLFAPGLPQSELQILDDLHLFNPYVTRLRTSVLTDHLDEDLTLSPAADASGVSNRLTASTDLNYPELDCGDDDGDGCRVGHSRQASGIITLLMIGFAVILAFGRRKL